MPTASFRFGANAEHEATVKCGYFGSEKYFVDGVLVLSHWSLWPDGAREFKAQGHSVRIRMSVNLKGARAEAFVDGDLVAQDLFAEFNATLARHRSEPSWLAKVAVWLVVALVVFSGFKFLERKLNHSEVSDTPGRASQDLAGNNFPAKSHAGSQPP